MSICEDVGGDEEGEDHFNGNNNGLSRGERSLHDGRKRKSLDFTIVDEKMKRCRIAVSPGEIRLRRDMEDCRDMSDVLGVGGGQMRISRTPDPLVVHLHFRFPNDNVIAPMNFQLKVPRYYPHSAPEILVSDSQFHGHFPYVRPNGCIHHPALHRHWDATKTLKDVIRCIYAVMNSDKEEGGIEGECREHAEGEDHTHAMNLG